MLDLQSGWTGYIAAGHANDRRRAQLVLLCRNSINIAPVTLAHMTAFLPPRGPFRVHCCA
jgi:hypothetical protein